jgi:tetratricopeptide (TPR) repeat protein
MVRRSRADALIAPASLDVPFRILGDMIDACALVERARQREEDGDDDGAIADFEHAVTLAIETGDASTVVAAHAGLVRVHFAAGHAQLVDAELERMRATMSSAVAATVRAEALSEWGLVLIERGEDGGRKLEEALALVAGEPAEPDRRRIEVRALMYRAHGERLRGDYAAALATLDRALAIAESTLGRDAQATAEVLNAQGVLGKFSGDFEGAERAYNRAARIIETRHGADHPDMAAIYHNLAGLAHAQGVPETAEPLARRSVEIRERTSGPGHLATILDRAGLAAILSDLGRDDEATELLERVLVDLEVAVGQEHREYAVTLNNLAALDQRRGDLEAAEARYRRALQIKERTQGLDAPALATTLVNLGTVLRRSGRIGEARAAFERAIGLLDGVVTSDHPTMIAARRNLGRLEP